MEKEDKNQNPIDKFQNALRQRKAQQRKDGPPNRASFALWYFVLVFILLIALQHYFLSKNVQTIPYSQFKHELSAGHISKLTIGTDTINGTLSAKGKNPEEFVTIRVEDPDLVKELDQKNVDYSGRYESTWLSNILTWIVPIAIFFIVWRLLMTRMGGPGAGIMSFGRSRAKLLVQDEIQITFNDVAGIDEAKQELQEVVEFLKNPDKFQRLGGRIPKGVLLVGAPGTGKTLLAKAVAGEAKVPFFSISGSEFVEMFVGVGASRVRDLFSQATNQAPCIIFIDELDALGKARGINVFGGNDEREQTLNQLLVEMDGFQTNKGVIIMAATNRPEILDPALLRPGRFDRQVLIDRPDINGREAILKIHSRNIVLGPEVDLRKIAALTPGFVGADLANVINEAALMAARKNKNAVGVEEFEEAIDRIVGGLEKKNRVMNPREKEIVAFHESGHAIVAESVKYADPVNKISIISRGIAALGYTQQRPTEDRYLLTRPELLDRLAVLLGGRAAEEIVFGEVSTGAQNDLQRATDIARSMVTEYGMSDRLGLATYERRGNPMFPPDNFTTTRTYSEAKGAEIDEEISRLLDEAHHRVQKILTDRRELLDHLAHRLCETEIVRGDELRKMIDEFREKKIDGE
ncbi:MAG: ATP-dependent zinc metalloprotease FtsH [Syntrophorhabdaceae bacterium]|nr:ATP-dependent zinc metalloprotease FtsH [Syntrophorhabdaceae bacterium]MDD4195867.1 ATP-dependent zinc metalloprotease FtsH [Syntrophorhabdaceae bacterium]